jgi:hypothetical protein
MVATLSMKAPHFPTEATMGGHLPSKDGILRARVKKKVIVQAPHLSSPRWGDGLGGGGAPAPMQARRLRTQESGIVQVP